VKSGGLEEQRMSPAKNGSKEGLRILVIKHGALGDIVQALDGFSSIRNGYPNAHIAILVGSPFSDFVKMMPWFDTVIPDKRANLFNFVEASRLKTCFDQGWHMVVDMQGTNRTKWYMRFFGRLTTCWIGRFSGASMLLPDFGKTNNSDRFVEISKIAGGVYEPANMDWLLGAQKNKEKDSDLRPKGPYSIIVPGCSLAKPQKRWPAERFAEIANALLGYGLMVLVVGTNDDRDAVDAVLALAPDAVDLCGKTNLVALAQLMQGADFVIGNDTGPMFLAAQTGVPSLMIIGPHTDPAMSAPKGAAASWLRGAPISKISAAAAINALESLGLKPNA
jgi:ADP-heptose:LPS heptosyltransferase